MAGVFAALALLAPPDWLPDQNNREIFRTAAFIYLVASALFVLTVRIRWPGYRTQLSLHIFTDIVLITALANASGGIASGLGLLLLVPLASAGLVGQGRLALLYAAMASIAMLGMHSIRVLQWQSLPQDYLQAGLLSMSFFAVVSLAHVLTRRAMVSEQASQEKAHELERINRIHALATADSSDGLLVLDERGQIIHSNAQAAKLPGLQYLAAGKLPPHLDPALTESIKHWKNRTGAANVMLPGGVIRARFLALDPVDPADTHSAHRETLVILEDPARAQALAQQLKLAALGRLTLNVAHEIRNPLSAISHASQLLAEETHGDATQRLVSIIGNNVQRLDRMVQDMLTLNRRDRQSQELIALATFMPVWLREWQQAEEIAENAVIMDMPEQLSIHFSPQHLHQILWNLASNAWRYCSKTPGAIRLTIRADAEHIRLSFCDDGKGVDTAAQAELFEPFHTTDPSGTGLGLYIARELAEANQSTLAFSGNQPGACFLLSIPRQAKQ